MINPEFFKTKKKTRKLSIVVPDHVSPAYKDIVERHKVSQARIAQRGAQK